MLSIQYETSIRHKYMNGFKRTKPVEWFVIHATAGGSTLNWIRSAKPGQRRYGLYKRGIALFHYLIQPDGTIVNLISPWRWVYHASVGLIDTGTIGVEMLNRSRDNSAPLTSQQYNSLAQLADLLLFDYPISKVISHNLMKKKYGRTGTGKVCPGPGFNWQAFEQTMERHTKFDLDLIEPEEYVIRRAA